MTPRWPRRRKDDEATEPAALPDTVPDDRRVPQRQVRVAARSGGIAAGGDASHNAVGRGSQIIDNRQTHIYHAPRLDPDVSESPPRVVPGQLPPVPAHFTNRSAEAALIDAAWDERREGAPATVVLSGPGGSGKTALASWWCRRVADRFPDGQLYADLGGFRAEPSATAEQVLRGFLRALGVAPRNVPVGTADQASLFRSLTAQSRLLVLLDNVASAAQVAPLIPGSANAMVMVTSRLRVPGLLAQGGVLVEVAVLSQEHATALLSRTVGAARGDTERQQLEELARLCGRLPIALCVAGARLASRPHWPVKRVVRELADEQQRLAALSLREGLSVSSVFDVSYEGLTSRQARAYRRLSLHPGPSFGLEVAAAAVELPDHEAADVLESLVDANVLEDCGADRYRFHDLVRLHAQNCVTATDGACVSRSVLERITEHYLALAVAVEHTVMPGEWHVGPAWGRVREGDAPFANSVEALDCLEGELPQLMAVLRAATEQGLDSLVWQLCEAMYALFLHRKHYQAWITAYGTGVEAAARCGNDAARSRMHHRRGVAFHNLARSQDACREGTAALDAARASGHVLAESAALQLIGMASRAMGRFDEATDTLRQAVDLDRRAGHFRSEALAQRLLGSAHLAAGHIGSAVEALEKACELAAGLPDPPVLAMSRVYLAEALTRAGRALEAQELARAAWAVMEDSGSNQYAARIMMAWGHAVHALGDKAAARTYLLKARDFFIAAAVPDLRPVEEALSRIETCSAGLATLPAADGANPAIGRDPVAPGTREGNTDQVVDHPRGDDGEDR
ncbi:ATP-binding protein [Streptomyces sp. NPDC102402]|uniref:ATP-binding protein n=1 Tax=Streptomyces sp. NPDC102402 TaxID=3366169 RepID=UPI003815C4E7